ncbi:putative membrane protein [[Clostridium] sordellii VPI 9048]|nr:putative membrane protein [[Clostridium] sordellii VPI 9048] [Paeniclostridium sordellii VPI 9048]
MISKKLKSEILLVIYFIIVLFILQHYIYLSEYKSFIWFIFWILKIIVCIETLSTAIIWYYELIASEI